MTKDTDPVHSWDSIVLEVDPIIERQLSVHKGYSVITVGHSLGAALAVLAAVHLKQKFDPYVSLFTFTTACPYQLNRFVKLYTYGSPRVGVSQLYPIENG